MPNYCVVYGCNSSGSDDISIHTFPKDPETRKKWICFVKNHRSCWDGPTKHSVICSLHFSADDFEQDLQNKLMKIKKRKNLRKGAVPCLFTPVAGQDSVHRSAFVKRERRRVRFNMISRCLRLYSSYSCAVKIIYLLIVFLEIKPYIKQ